MGDEKKPKIKKVPKVDVKKTKLKIPKLPKTKSGLLVTMLTAPKKAYQLYKKKKKKFKSDTEEYVKQQKSEATTLGAQKDKIYTDLSSAHKKIWDAGEKAGWSKARILKYIAGGGTLAAIGGGGVKLYSDVKKEMERAKGGYVRKMKAGGSVRRMNAGGSVSRGTGAAIQGTKFKGVF